VPHFFYVITVILFYFYSLVFRWLAIPWLQSELDKWVTIRNRTLPRADTKKVLPHGIPELMREKPEQFGALNFKVIGCSIHFLCFFFLPPLLNIKLDPCSNGAH
jgi:hypothetical protein